MMSPELQHAIASLLDVIRYGLLAFLMLALLVVVSKVFG